MKYLPGQQVLVLDTTLKPAGSAFVKEWHPETNQYTVLYQYPGSPVPELIDLPEQRLITHSSFRHESPK